jgi:hypothetical protein
MVCNALVSDSDLIDRLGGSSALAKRLGYPLAGGVQRVQNWKRRGIPPRVKLEWPELFLAPPPDEKSKATTGADAASVQDPQAA